jgi:hypothetical protein
MIFAQSDEKSVGASDAQRPPDGLAPYMPHIFRHIFRGVLEGRSPSNCAAGAPHHKLSKFPAHSAPERAVAASYADKIDFYGNICTES